MDSKPRPPSAPGSAATCLAWGPAASSKWHHHVPARTSQTPDAQRGVVVLGSPVSHPAFVQAWAEDRLRAEQELFDQLPKLPDLQCACLPLLMCASPRASHAIRTIMPPSASATYARGRDDAIWMTLQAMLGGMGDAEAAHARQVAALPGALGGLGLLSAEAIAPAAYWAS